MDIFLSPEGKHQVIHYGNPYRAAVAVFDSKPELYDMKAQASVDKGKVVGFEDFLVSIGYAYMITLGDNILPDELTDAQKFFFRVYLHSFGEAQKKLLIERGVVTQEHVQDITVKYYTEIIDEISAQYEDTIYNTYGNSHDFNMKRSNIRHAISQLNSAANMEKSDERTEKIKGLITPIRYNLIKFRQYAEAEVKPIRMHERLIKLNNIEEDGKLRSYMVEKRNNIRRLLNMEE